MNNKRALSQVQSQLLQLQPDHKKSAHFNIKESMLQLFEHGPHDVQLIANGGKVVSAQQQILKPKSTAIHSLLASDHHGIIIMADVEFDALNDFLKMLYTEELEVNQLLSLESLLEVLFLYEKYAPVHDFRHIKQMYFEYFKQKMTLIDSVVVFVRSCQMKFKEFETLAWSWICKFIKSVFRCDLSVKDNFYAEIEREGIPNHMLEDFGITLRNGSFKHQVSKTFSEDKSYISCITLADFIHSCKLISRDHSAPSAPIASNVIKSLNSEEFYRFASTAFVDKRIEDLSSVPPSPDKPVSTLNSVNRKYRTRSACTLDAVHAIKDKEYVVKRLVSFSPDFNFTNTGQKTNFSFVVDTPIRILKLALCGAKNVPSYIDEYEVVITLIDSKKNIVVGTAMIVLRKAGPKYYVQFDPPIPITPQKKYVIESHVKGPPSCMGLVQQSMVKIKCESTIVTFYFPPHEVHDAKIPEVIFLLD